MNISNVVGIIGWPVAHSLSPLMQNAAFLESNLDSWAYVAMPVNKLPYIRIKEAVLGLRALGLKGANVTIPHKEAVVPYLDRLSSEARAIGAVNTISIDSEGYLVGHNTDGRGFVNDLLDNGVDLTGMHVMILGAGGSARAVVHALLEHGVKQITILNRTKTKADDIARSFGPHFPDATLDTKVLSRDAIRETAYADLVVNTTSIGMGENAGQMPWDENLHFAKTQIVYDLIYNPKLTKLLLHAQKDGARIFNGLGMLVNQGALSFQIWTGAEAPIDAMKKAVREFK